MRLLDLFNIRACSRNRLIQVDKLYSMVLLLLALGGLIPQETLAATETVTLHRLGVKDAILLPTVSSQYIAKFTLPKTWQMSAQTSVELSFQHSSQLLPDRSWLQVILNDHVIKHIPLTKENISNTVLRVPLPLNLLQQDNELAFRVEQHYTHHCEDPLDKSLWTQVLPATKVVLDYQLRLPTLDLAAYPYPIVDTLAYSPSRLHYVVLPDSTSQLLEALAMVNTHLAQESGKQELRTFISSFDKASSPQESIIYVATAEQLSRLQVWKSALGGDLEFRAGRWKKRSTDQDLPDDQGVLLFKNRPGSAESPILVVSGNSEKGVLQAARYLTSRPHTDGLRGAVVLTPGSWEHIGNHTNKRPHYLEKESRTLQELEIPTQEVHKINAPPIVYKIPIMADFKPASGAKLWLDLSYSYAPGLNPTFSSLELRMNDRSFINIPLTNEQGENNAHASVLIPNDLIKPNNELVAQFHMEPDKKGWCVDNYIDKSWGKILDNSRFRIEGVPGDILPDTRVMPIAMFPYSRDASLENLRVILPEHPTASLLQAMLAWTMRLGKNTPSDTDIRLSVTHSGNLEAQQNGVAFLRVGDRLDLPAGEKLTWSGEQKLLSVSDSAGAGVNGALSSDSRSVYLEQIAVNNGHVMSIWTEPKSGDFNALATVLESDDAFAIWQQNLLKQPTVINQFSIAAGEEMGMHLNSLEPVIHYHQEGTPAPVGGLSWISAFWSSCMNWISQIIIQIKHLFGVAA